MLLSDTDLFNHVSDRAVTSASVDCAQMHIRCILLARLYAFKCKEPRPFCYLNVAGVLKHVLFERFNSNRIIRCLYLNDLQQEPIEWLWLILRSQRMYKAWIKWSYEVKRLKSTKSTETDGGIWNEGDIKEVKTQNNL